MDNKKAFLSFSYSDRDFAEQIAFALQKESIDVWWAEWEIKPGDSLIQRIFVEGLSNCDVFLILLSEASVQSRWVKEELNAAMIRRIEDLTKIIPIVKEKCDIPLSLRTLKWVDLSTDFEGGIREIVKSIYNVSEKPPVGKKPEYISELQESVNGLSKIASTIALKMLETSNDKSGRDKSFTGKELVELSPDFTPAEINDAIDELKEYGFVNTHVILGTAPFDFSSAQPTYALFLNLKDHGLDYDPVEDIKKVASAVVGKGEISGVEAHELTKLSPIRINRSVSYLEDNGLVEIIQTLGTAPYTFRSLVSTRKTRQFVDEKCK